MLKLRVYFPSNAGIGTDFLKIKKCSNVTFQLDKRNYCCSTKYMINYTFPPSIAVLGKFKARVFGLLGFTGKLLLLVEFLSICIYIAIDRHHLRGCRLYKYVQRALYSWFPVNMWKCNHGRFAKNALFKMCRKFLDYTCDFIYWAIKRPPLK